MTTLTQIILATGIISLLSFIGVLALVLKEKFLNRILFILVAFAAGALIGSAFLHLLPEGIEMAEEAGVDILFFFLFPILGFVVFFIIERILHWHHCHDGKCEIHTFSYINLVGDFVHNFIDGLIIAASFLVNPALGLFTTLAIAFHEIPQEIGDLGILIYGGFSKWRALFLNFAVALTSILGGIIGFYLSPIAQNLSVYLIPFAAGGFLYLAASDLLPEIRSIKNLRKSNIAAIVFIFGIVFMWVTKVYFG